MSDTALMEGRQPIPEERLVTLANWQLPPGNRWAFQHVRELVPTARIRRGEGPGWDLERDERDVGEVRFHSGGRAHTVREMLDTSETDGFLVLHRGRIVAEQYFNGMGPETPHLLQSVSKSITAAAAGALVGRGVLDPSARLEDVVPELGATAFAGATVQQLLDMRTGTRFNEDYADDAADVRRFEQVYLWRPRSGDALPDDALAYFATLTNDEDHGGEFRYRSVLTDVMAWVIESAAGARFHEVVATELWGPMGAEFDAEVTVDAHGNAMADGGISAALRDLGRLGLLYLHAGRRGDSAVLPAAWVADTVAGTAESRRAFAASGESRAFPGNAHYRNYWWIYDAAAPFFYAAGINGQNLFVHGPTQTVVVKLSTWPTALDEVKQASLREATLAIGAYLDGQRGLKR